MNDESSNPFDSSNVFLVLAANFFVVDNASRKVIVN